MIFGYPFIPIIADDTAALVKILIYYFYLHENYPGDQ